MTGTSMLAATSSTAADVAAHILKSLALSAHQATGEDVHKVVITVPAYFGQVERDMTAQAGAIAGLEVLGIINEPVAAALSYRFALEAPTDETVLVYDLGGGTFDTTVVKLTGDAIEVIATDGNHRLGGVDWDECLTVELARRFREANPEAGNPLDDPIGAVELRGRAEDLKRSLSTRDTLTELVQAGAARATVTITRQEFEDITRHLLEETIQSTHAVIDEAAEKGSQRIDRVLLVGGSSLMPAVPRRLNEEFGWTPELRNPNLAVALGAAWFAAHQQVIDIVGTAGVDPAKIKDAAETLGITPQRVRDLVKTKITNVCSRGFGIKVLRPEYIDDVHAGRMDEDDERCNRVDHLVKRNDKLPLTTTGKYATSADNQRQIHLVVYEQGGADLSDRMSDNNFVVDGHFDLPDGLPEGTPLQVAFALAENGTLTVTLSRPGDDKTLVLTHDVSSALTPDEVATKTREFHALYRAS